MRNVLLAVQALCCIALLANTGCSKKEEPVAPTVLIATPNGIFDQNGRPVVIQNANGQWSGNQAPQTVQPQQYQQAPQQMPSMPYYPAQAPVSTTVPDNSGITTGEVVGAAALAAAAGAAGYLAGKNKQDTTVQQYEPARTYQPSPMNKQPEIKAPVAKIDDPSSSAVKPDTASLAPIKKIENTMASSGPAVTAPPMKSQVPISQASTPSAYAQQAGVPTKSVQAAPRVSVPTPAPARVTTPSITISQSQPSTRWSAPAATSSVSRSVSSSSSSSGGRR